MNRSMSILLRQVLALSDFVGSMLAGSPSQTLSGLDRGEKITLPSVRDVQLVAGYETAGANLFAASQQTGKPSPRYMLKP